MKVYVNTLATLCILQTNVAVITGFVASTAKNHASALYSSNGEPARGNDKSFFANLATQRLNSNQGVETRPDQRSPSLTSTTNPGRVDQMERTLEQRLSKLEQAEKQLEQRMSSIAQTERALQQRMSSVDRTGAGTSGSTPRGQRPTEGSDIKLSYNAKSINEIWETSTPTTIQGSSLRTWSFANPAVRRVHVLLKTDGRPLDADIQLWQGPDNTPNKMKVYVEDGAIRTFSAFIDTPDGPNAICVKNIGPLEFPLYACVGPDVEASAACLDATKSVKGEIIQGGALRTYPFGVQVDSVAVLIKTNGRPLNARIELLQGPNNNKQVLELYTEDGLARPLLCVVQTPGSGNVLRIVNKAPVEFPMHASVVEYEYSEINPYATDGIQIGDSW